MFLLVVFNIKSMIEIYLTNKEEYPAAQAFYSSVKYYTPIVESDKVFIAKKADEIVGVVRLSFEEGYTLLRGMFIAPHLQRQGIGSLMIKELEKHIESRAAYCLPHGWLENFYGQIGFRKISDIEAPPHMQIRINEYRNIHPQMIVMGRFV